MTKIDSNLLRQEAERLGELAVRLLEELETPQELGDDPHLTSVWLADRMIDVARVNIARAAAEAELADERIGDIALAMGEANTSNARRRVPEWARIRDSQRAADLAGVHVTIRSRGLSYTLEPRAEESL